LLLHHVEPSDTGLPHACTGIFDGSQSELRNGVWLEVRVHVNDKHRFCPPLPILLPSRVARVERAGMGRHLEEEATIAYGHAREIRSWGGFGKETKVAVSNGFLLSQE